MDCPHCGHHNQDESKFCNECGNQLTLVCPNLYHREPTSE